jgi:hypothetical protein
MECATQTLTIHATVGQVGAEVRTSRIEHVRIASAAAIHSQSPSREFDAPN